MTMRNVNGQLLLPTLGVLFLFGMFWVTYVLWCRTVYWKMRMDVAADFAALSAAREQAAILNYTGTFQFLENTLLPEIKGYGILDVSMRSNFEAYNAGLQMYVKSFGAQVYAVAQKVADDNGCNLPLLPTTDSRYSANTDAQLQPHAVKVLYVASGWPVGWRTYPVAYYTRAWSPDIVKAQPTHKSYWQACHDTICGEGRARLWLDVDPKSELNDGGFPSANASLLRSIGIQCFYPQFNAQLLPKK